MQRVAAFLRRLRVVVGQAFANERRREVDYDWFTRDEVAGFDRARQASFGAPDARIDDGTWSDLDVDAYLRQIGSRASIFGRQMLYHLLRAGAAIDDAAKTRLQAAVAQPADVLSVQQVSDARHRLRCVETDPTQTLFHGGLEPLPAWTRLLRWAPYAATLCLSLLLLMPGAASASLLAAYVVLNGWVQIRLHRMLVRWRSQRDDLVVMLGSALALAKHGTHTGHPLLQPLAQDKQQFSGLLARLTPAWLERITFFAEYANLFALHEYAQLNARVAALRAEIPGLQAIYQAVAQCEAEICLAEHLQEAKLHCWSTPCEDRELTLEGVVNPLLPNAERLSIRLSGEGAFLTGQNGVGKSTFLRGVGLNLLSARAFGFCYADLARVPHVPVWSSIQAEDSLANADSLYMAEMRRAETLLRVADGPIRAVFLVDEIFRGTNHIESVSAAAAVLAHLSERALVIVSSHNLVLAPLLQRRLVPLRIVRADPRSTALSLEPGVLSETNGIRLMEHYAIPCEILRQAGEVHEWLSGYMTQPDHVPPL